MLSVETTRYCTHNRTDNQLWSIRAWNFIPVSLVYSQNLSTLVIDGGKRGGMDVSGNRKQDPLEHYFSSRKWNSSVCVVRGRMSRLRCNRAYANSCSVASRLIFKTTFRSCDLDVKNGQRGDVASIIRGRIIGRAAISLNGRIFQVFFGD